MFGTIPVGQCCVLVSGLMGGLQVGLFCCLVPSSYLCVVWYELFTQMDMSILHFA